MATRTVLKVVTNDYQSDGWMARVDHSDGYATPGPLAALNLTYTVGTQVTPDPDLENSVKAALIAAYRANTEADGPTPPAWWYLGPDASAGIRIEPRLALLARRKRELHPNGRIVELQYDDTDVLRVSPCGFFMLRTAFVTREVGFDGSGHLVTI
jgi:hypothetical protein